MDEYSEETYGERIAGIYDEWYSEFDPAAITALSEIAHGGSVLELGIGTGRIAIPLHDAGVRLQGIDVSSSMVAKLHAKPGGEKIKVRMGNFADVNIPGKFSLIYIVFNTFFQLLTQEEQIRCFRNVAGHLLPEGLFVIEAFVPDLTRFTDGQAMRVNRVGDKQVQIDVSDHEADKQLVVSQHVLLTEQGTQFFPVKIRYAWPTEMDLMARLAQLQLRERWGNWSKAPFTADSGKHISIYEIIK